MLTRPAVLALLTVLLVATPAAAAQVAPALPLGSPSLAETRTAQVLSPGVTHTRIVRGAPDSDDHWTVNLAVVARRAQARTLAAEVREDGFEAEVVKVQRFRYVVRSGAFDTRDEALVAVRALAAAGHPGAGAVFTAEDGGPTSGPWVVNVLAVDPDQFAGRVAPVLATGIVPGRAPLSAFSAGAIGAVNGGYFVLSPADGTDGDLAGSSILGGQLISEAVDGRTDLILPGVHGRGAFVSSLSDVQTVHAGDGAQREVDGDNRTPGLIRGCGGTGGDQPTEQPLHDVTCTDSSELIRFTSAFGDSTAPGPGAEAVVDASGTVTALRAERGGTIPVDGSVLAGTGDGAEWLDAHAQPGAQLTVETTARTERGPLALRAGLSVVNGGPRLVRDGRLEITERIEGFDHPGDPSFLYAFGIRRNPRTIAGVTPGGKLLLVAVEGRAPGYSAGASFREEARIMQALGAVEAVNLDGGGSTTMTVGGLLLTRPSDATGERPIGDGIVILPSP